MIELLTGVLVGNPVVSRFPLRQRRWQASIARNGTIIAIDVEAFMPLAEFKSSVGRDARHAQRVVARRRIGADSVSGRTRRRAPSIGNAKPAAFPIAVGAWQKLGKDAAKLGVPLPRTPAPHGLDQQAQR